MHSNRPLTLRAEAAPEQNRDFNSRGVVVRAATVDEKTRSVDVTMSGEDPVTVFDWDKGFIDEVLLADGGQYPAQMPLLDCHSRYSLDNVLGAVRNIRRDGQSWVGRAYFAAGDDIADKAWNKVRQGILTDVSIGYRSTQYVDIPAGQSASVAGRQYTANAERPLRVTSRYEPKELSVVPIGADQRSKIRGDGGPSPITQPGDTGGKVQIMDKVLRQYLESLGLRHDASDEQARAFLAVLGGELKVRADAIAAKTMTLEAAIAAGKTTPTAVDGQRAAAPVAGTVVQTAVLESPQGAEAIRAETLRAERERVNTIRSLAGPDVDPELVSRAESEAWTVERAGREFLKSVREGRAPAVGADGARAPGGFASNHERDCTRESLGIALFMRGGARDEKQLKAVVNHLNQRRAKAGLQVLAFDNVAQQAQRYDDMSLFDMCREAIRLDGRQVPYSRDETIRAAISGGSLTQIFTTSVNAMVLVGYEEEPDTTIWCAETDVPDFKINTDIRFNVNAGLKKLGRGQTAEHANADDSAETYKAARYAKQWAADEQDIIDDSMSALSSVPQEFGNAARRLRPDLVYAMVLANPTMADTGQVFNSTALTTAGGHANYAASGSADALGAALSAGSLQAAVVAMGKQYRGSGRNKVPLNIRPQYLVYPTDLKFTAEILVQSAQRFRDSDLGDFNPLKGTLTPIGEQRLGATGVTDPDTGTTYTGTAVNYFLFARAGLHAKVAYRRGTNRAPMIRSYQLDKGQWGIGFDINHDIGCKFTEFRGAFFAKGSA